MNDKETPSAEPTKTGKIPTRQNLYSLFTPHATKAIDVLLLAMEKGNMACKIGAAKTILAKLVPDLKATELTGKDGQQFTINLIRDYITQTGRYVSASEGGAEGSIKIQGTDMASESKKDIDTIGEDGNRMP